MGWLLKTQETKKHGTRYKIWSTISDSYLHDKWQTREEVVQFLFWDRIRDALNNFMNDAMTFPNKYFDKDTRKRYFDDKKSSDYYKLSMKCMEEEDDDLWTETIENLLSEYGLHLKVSDGEYGFDNKPEIDDSEEDILP